MTQEGILKYLSGEVPSYSSCISGAITIGFGNVDEYGGFEIPIPREWAMDNIPFYKEAVEKYE